MMYQEYQKAGFLASFAPFWLWKTCQKAEYWLELDKFYGTDTRFDQT